MVSFATCSNVTWQATAATCASSPLVIMRSHDELGKHLGEVDYFARLQPSAAQKKSQLGLVAIDLPRLVNNDRLEDFTCSCQASGYIVCCDS